MKTNRLFLNNKKALMAFMSAAVIGVSFIACSQDDELFEAEVPQKLTGQTRASCGLEPITYVERSWDGQKVVSTEKNVTSYTELKENDDGNSVQLESGKWYVVKSNCLLGVIIAPEGKPANLIVCDGAKLTSCIEICLGHSLNIFGQAKDAGQLIARSHLNHELYPAIGSSEDMGKLVIHGCNISAETLQENNSAIGGGWDGSGGDITIYGGTVKAQGGRDAAGIGTGEGFTERSLDGGKLFVYGGDVFADGTGWGAGIGGGEDAKGAKVYIFGGKVVAWAGQDAGKKNGSAIGSEDGDGRRGSLQLGDNMIVYAGQNPDDANKHLIPFETRVPACYFRPYCRVEVRK